MRLGHFLLTVVGWLLALLGIAWAAAALWFDGPTTRWLAGLLAAAVVLAGLRRVGRPAADVARGARPAGAGRRRRRCGGAASPPATTATGCPTSRSCPSATIEGDRLTIRNVRNFDYRTETDFTERWETRTYDLAQLRGGDMFFSFWGPTFDRPYHRELGLRRRPTPRDLDRDPQGTRRVLFGPAAGSSASTSSTTSSRTSATSSACAPTTAASASSSTASACQSDRARAILLDYLEEVNRLADEPRWYNALTHNCTTTIRDHARHIGAVQPWSWQILANGYLDRLWYDRGVLDTSLPFAELKTRSDITERAKAADGDPTFSTRIREGSRPPDGRNGLRGSPKGARFEFAPVGARLGAPVLAPECNLEHVPL